MAGRSELVFGLVGPVGCPIHEAGEALESALKRVDYKPHVISISDEMDKLLEGMNFPIPSDGESTLENKIMKGNAVREAFENNSVLAAEAIRQIIKFRIKASKDAGEKDQGKIDDAALLPLDEHAFIIRQLKRPEEIELLVKAFGKSFVQVSVVTPLDARLQALIARLRSEQHGWDNDKCKVHAERLIKKDQDEKSEPRGQRISKIFHLGDVFLSGHEDGTLESSSRRFIEALFGRNNIGPTRAEFGSYTAKAAALRSVDMSRQVGAAIFSSEGDLISLGCNEVPKAGGGNYWDEDQFKRRDVDVGGEANKGEINRMVFDFIKVLKAQDLIKSNMLGFKIEVRRLI
jgi:deoxycytidylate deaminase